MPMPRSSKTPLPLGQAASSLQALKVVNVPRLSVNFNKVALLRNSRRTGVPDLLHFADLAYEFGANGITVHPRPDQRHIREDDVYLLAERMKLWRPGFELNIEGYPDDRLLRIVEAVRPEQCTLVPDSPTAFTSEEGWKFDARDTPVNMRDAVTAFRQIAGRLIVFIDPEPSVIAGAIGSGADGVEIYTGLYAAQHRAGGASPTLKAAAETSSAARAAGLLVNIGHDLNLSNLPLLLSGLHPVHEASIGHELTADALTIGFGPAIRAYKDVLGASRQGDGA